MPGTPASMRAWVCWVANSTPILNWSSAASPASSRRRTNGAGKLCAAQRRDPFDLGEVRDGQQAGHDRQADAERVAAIAEAEEVVVVVK